MDPSHPTNPETSPSDTALKSGTDAKTSSVPGTTNPSSTPRHSVYLVECSDGTLYCGYSTDVWKRVKTHNAGRGAKYTRARRPVKLIYFETYPTKREALQRDAAIKKLSRNDKITLVIVSKGRVYGGLPHA